MDNSRIVKRQRTPDSPSTEQSGQNSKRRQTDFDTSSLLCKECQSLDLDTSFELSYIHYEQLKDVPKGSKQGVRAAPDGTHYYNDAILVHRFGSRLYEASDCGLCEFFRSLRVLPDAHRRHKLLAFRSSESWLFQANLLSESMKLWELDHELIDTVFMAVVPDINTIPPGGYEVTWLDYEIPNVGAIFRQPLGEVSGPENHNLLGARELSDGYDLDRVKLWLDACRSEHGDACKQRASQEPITRGFRLINCNTTPPVVEDKPWGTPYVALSYVWGSTAADLEDWPATVLDAVEVAKELALPYLWVDRLCINQSDPVEKGYLISRMTTIYEAADFTIVAAAGNGASHGLPGVRSTPRALQPKYYLDSGSLLLSVLRDPRREILDSPYWTRGW